MRSSGTNENFSEHLSTAASDVYAQPFAAYKIKLKRLINDLINDLGYLYEYYIIRDAYL